MAYVDLLDAFAIQNGLVFEETGIAIASALSSPSSGAGTSAPNGSLWFSSNDGVFLKVGVNDLDWNRVISPTILAGQTIINGSDTTGGFLFDKLTVTNNLTKTLVTPNGNETLLLDLSDIGTSGSFVGVTTDSKGRVVAGSTTQQWSTIVNTPSTISGYGVTLTYNDLPLKLYQENVGVGFTPASALGENSIALGEGANAVATDSLAIGKQSLARINGGVVQANGRFASTGDAQAGRYLLRSHSVNNAPVELFLDGTNGSTRLTLQDNSTWSFRILVTAHQTDSDDGHAGFEASGVIYRASGAATTMLLGQVSKTILARSNTSWDINIVSDAGNGSLKITATGELSKTIRWVALVETLEVTN